MHITVAALLHEVRMGGEIVVPRVLEYEVTARMKQVVGEYLVRYPGQAVYGVGRVRKDEVEFFRAYFQEVEDIVMHHGHIVEAKVPGLGTDE